MAHLAGAGSHSTVAVSPSSNATGATSGNSARRWRSSAWLSHTSPGGGQVQPQGAAVPVDGEMTWVVQPPRERPSACSGRARGRRFLWFTGAPRVTGARGVLVGAHDGGIHRHHPV
jgi:hypothetical protein